MVNKTSSFLVPPEITYFIKAPCHQSSRDSGYQFAPNEVKQNYDYTIDIELFKGTTITNSGDNNIKICEGYNKLYDHIVNDIRGNNKIVTIGGDFSICAATIPAINDKYMSKLKVICISPYHHLNTFDNLENLTGLHEVAISSAIGNLNPSLVKPLYKFNPQQLVYLGIDREQNDLEILDHFEITYFTKDKIEQIGIEKICEIVKMYTIDDYNVHLCINMDTSSEYIKQIVNSFKEQIVSMDITEFNPCINKRIIEVKECIRDILINAFNVKEKTINIFNEDSRFLIYRPLVQEDPETDIGWYILRGMTTDQKKDIISQLDNDKAITIIIDDEDYLITTTSMNEQNIRSYFTATSIQDFTLFPSDKQMMCFEMLNNGLESNE